MNESHCIVESRNGGKAKSGKEEGNFSHNDVMKGLVNRRDEGARLGHILSREKNPR